MSHTAARHTTAPIWGLVCYGACALLAQLALLQELLIVFTGHELFLGYALASWMVWVGAGSWWARRAPSTHLARWLPAIPPLILANVVAIRLSARLFGVGMLPGVLPMLGLTAALLAPTGSAVGACFTWGCDWCNRRHGMPLGTAYVADTVGAAIGGALYTAVIAGRLSTDWIVAGLAVPVTIVAVVLRSGRRLRAMLAIGALVLAVAWAASPLPRVTRAAQWRGYTVIAERTSRYSHLTLATTGSLTSLFDNGVLAAHFPDPAAYEELVHWPLLAHPHPRRVLVIGGAATGTLTELLRHPVTHIDYVEIDPALIALLRPALDPADRAALDDARVHLIHQDGRRWLDHTTARYDVILLQLPEPLNAQINRLYTLEAFRAVGRHLAPGGIFAFTIPSSENYLSPEMGYLNACLYETLRAAFPSVELIAGDPLLLMASHEPLHFDVTTLAARYRTRGLRTRAVVPSYMPVKLDPERRAFLLAQLHAARAVGLNRDFFPACYAYAWRVWLSKFVSPRSFLGSLAGLLLLAWLIRMAWRRRGRLLREPGRTALYALGGAGIVYETLLLLAFQSLHGYVYWQLGALFATFMVGLALGCALTARRAPALSATRARRWLRLILLATAVEGWLLAWALPACRLLPTLLPPLLVFGVLLAGSACWLGMAFPLAARLADPSQSTAQTAGELYAADLWGAALGALVASSALVPLTGLLPTAALTGAVLLLAAVALPRLPRAG